MNAARKEHSVTTADVLEKILGAFGLVFAETIFAAFVVVVINVGKQHLFVGVVTQIFSDENANPVKFQTLTGVYAPDFVSQHCGWV